MLYVYAITDVAASADSRGLFEAPIRVVGDGPPFGIVSEHAELDLGPSEDDLWAHEQVVEGLMEHGAVLPLRFGSTVADEEELATILAERREEFSTALDRVRNAVELGVRARLREGAVEVPAPVAAEAAGAGTLYMRERLESERRRAATSELIHERLESLSRRSTRRPAGADAFTAAYLVDRGRVDAFRKCVDELCTQVEGATIVCTGPWPPYSFSSAEEAA